MLGHVERVDAEGFFESIKKGRDRRRICGLPAIYTMLQTMNAKEGTLLKYDQAFTSETQSVVSFASLAFHESEVRSNGFGVRRRQGLVFSLFSTINC